ncbi:MAG TPA: glutamine synthetase family protein [Candidatus Bathyarchaeia archaeon]|nr:glutamine synthetase family protein [Candidatus Bathyarchaeia archaeon]
MSVDKYDLESVTSAIQDSKVDFLTASYVDFGGISRTKARPVKYVKDFLIKGVKFAKANFALTSFDIAVPQSGFTVASGEVQLIPDLNTFAVPKYANKIAKFMGDLFNIDGTPWNLCPRSAFRQVAADAEELGYVFVGGAEMEFSVVRVEDGKVLPFESGGIQSQHGFEISQSLMQAFIDASESSNIEVTKAHVEGGGTIGGQFEIDMHHSKAPKCADDIVAFRDAMKAVAREHGYTATFLAKVSDQFTGSGMHLHSSLVDKKTGRNLFADKDDDRKLDLSQLAYYFIGGLLEHTRALCAVVAPNVNSYRRLVYPGRWAADAVAYGPNHRGLAVRVLEEVKSEVETKNVEFRVPDPSGNPYLGFACLLAAGLDGIRKKIDPGDPITST